MPRRSGISTNPEARIAHWRRQYASIRGVQIVGPFTSRAAAQQWEIAQPGISHPGGADPQYRGARWYGYTFLFTERSWLDDFLSF